MFWLCVAAIVIATVAALVLARRLQLKYLQHSFRLEISNAGNVRSRYYLRTESSHDLLDFRFVLQGDPLPEAGPAAGSQAEAVAVGPSPTAVSSGQPAAAGGSPGVQSQVQAVEQKANKALGLGGYVADVLTSIGSLLPTRIGSPLLRQAARLQRGRMEVRRVQGMQNRVRQVKSLVPTRKAKSGGTASSPASAAVVTQVAPALVGWVETPHVLPKEMLAIDLLVRAMSEARGRQFTFKVLSRSADQQGAPLVTEAGVVHVSSGFWSHRFLPYALILALSLALLVAAGWLASNGYLAW